MRRRLAGLLVLLLASPAWAVTDVYFDGGCTNDGNGGCNGGTPPDCNCAASAGAAGPYKYLHSVFGAADACNTNYNIRGVHSTHGSNHAAGTFDGRYFGGAEWIIDVTGCGSGTPLVIQNQGWTAPGTGETVYLDGVRCPHPAGCSNCDASSCQGQDAAGKAWENCDWDSGGSNCDCGATVDKQIGSPSNQTSCEETWFTVDNGTSGSGFQNGTAAGHWFAMKDNGEMTYHATSFADMTNSHAGYNASRCSSASWRPCTTATLGLDCPAGDTCTSSVSPEVDHYTEGGVMFVRWGNSLPTKPYIAYTNPGDGFALKDNVDYVTIRGVNFRGFKTALFMDRVGSDHNTVKDVRIFYMTTSGNGDGGAYGISIGSPDQLTVEDSEVAYTASETIHTAAVDLDSRASIVFIRRNRLHNTGDQSIMGTSGSTATPSGATLSSASGDRGGNYAGSIFEDNIIWNLKKNTGSTSGPYGLRLENFSKGWIIRNNLIGNTEAAECITLSGNCAKCIGGATTPPGNCPNGVGDCTAPDTCQRCDSSNNQIYNNAFANCGNSNHVGFGLWCEAGGIVTGTRFDHNTVYNSSGDAIAQKTYSGFSCQDNDFTSNILQPLNTKKVVQWGTVGTGDLFDFNLGVTSAGTAATWGASNPGCSTLSSIGAGNRDNCPSPSFVDTAIYNFHLQSGSPAKDVGTTRCCSSTADINNTIAGSYGFPSYADNQACSGTCDIGADEFVAAGSSPRKIIVVAGQ